MKIIPERVTVIPDAQKNELTILMEGFRLTFSAEEARTLGYALMQGIKQLPDGARSLMAPPPPGFPNKPPTTLSAPDAASSKPAETGTDSMRSLSA